MDPKIVELQEKIKDQSQRFIDIQSEIHKIIVGQNELVQSLIIGILSDGHILLEGVPGLAKTLSVTTLSKVIKADYKRIQFTPDLLPADLIGTNIFNQKTCEFNIKKGPIFTNLLLADEINRAPAKVQSALLEAMQEKQVTISQITFKLPEFFIVLATQNPIEQEGTYQLPEAQIDRFMLKVKLDYPTEEEELQIINRMTDSEIPKVSSIIENIEEIIETRKLINQIYVDEKIKNYIVDIIFATRKPRLYGLELDNIIEFGASPRGSLYLTICSKVVAFLNQRAYVIPDDIKTIAMNVLQHRITITYEAEAENIKKEDIIKQILNKIKVP